MSEVVNEEAFGCRSILDAIPDPVVIYDPEGCVTYLNPAFEQTFEWRKQELQGHQIDFVPDECRLETDRAVGDMIAGKPVAAFETRRKTKTGKIVDIQLSATRFEDARGRLQGYVVIMSDIGSRRRQERALDRSRSQLESQVTSRTADLTSANQRLEAEVRKHKSTERSLKARERELEQKTLRLKEVNTALRVLLRRRDEDKVELGENVIYNLRELVMPYLEKLKRSRLDKLQVTYLDVIETNLKEIAQPFVRGLSSVHLKLTPMEIQVTNLIKQGKTSKEIGGLLRVSTRTIEFHRDNIRHKFGIKNKPINLHTYLMNA